MELDQYVLGGAVVAGLQWFTASTLSILLGVAAALIIGWTVIYSLRRLLSLIAQKRQKQAARKALVRQRRQEHWQWMERRWLLDNLRLSKKTETVDLKRLPTPPNLRRKAVQKFRVSYWSPKARICRPFAK